MHSILHSNDYYNKINLALGQVKSRKDAIQKLQRIRETLEDGTFFHASL